MRWDQFVGEIVDLGTEKVHLYHHLIGFPESCAVLEVSREEVRNAIDTETAMALHRALDELDAMPFVRTIFITGRGDKAFVSGGDLREYSVTLDSTDKVRAALGVMRQVLWRIYSNARFAVAIINGPARGGGAELAFSCHYRIMSDHASIGFVQVTQGIPPGWGGGMLLADQVGKGKAKLALMSGSVFDAEDALRLGFVDEVVNSDEEMITHMKKVADRFSRTTSTGMAAIHSLLSSANPKLLQKMELESEHCVRLWFDPAHKAILTKYS